MRRRRTGRRLHDPAWHGQDFSRRRHASGNRPACVRGDHRRRQGRDQPGDRPEKPRIRTTKRPVSVHNPAHWLRSCDRGYEPQIEISIAFNCGPRVPSSGTFVRLPAPETLHGRRLAASGELARNAELAPLQFGFPPERNFANRTGTSAESPRSPPITRRSRTIRFPWILISVSSTSTPSVTKKDDGSMEVAIAWTLL